MVHQAYPVRVAAVAHIRRTRAAEEVVVGTGAAVAVQGVPAVRRAVAVQDMYRLAGRPRIRVRRMGHPRIPVIVTTCRRPEWAVTVQEVPERQEVTGEWSSSGERRILI